MLTIPNEIQTLFKTDSVLKNFRVQFPNGENADLTNADIVAESVSFSESICSKEVFQFGLSERSCIQFECVGVPNIYGVTIECGIEIDTSTLSAAEIAAIELNPGDGVLVKAADSDIGYGFYRVPYGVFIVESCPRSQGAMKHRRVTAYSSNSEYSVMTYFAQQKYTKRITDHETVAQNVALLLGCERGDVDSMDTTETDITPSTLDSGASTFTIGESYQLRLRFNNKFTSVNDSAAAYRARCTYDSTLYDTIAAALKALGISEAEIETKVGMYLLPHVDYECIYNGQYALHERLTFSDNEDSGFIYPYMPVNESDGGFVYMMFPYQVTEAVLKTYPGGALVQDFGTASNICTNCSLKKYTLNDTDENALFINITQTGLNVTNTNEARTFIDSLNLAELSSGMFELNGQFGKRPRSGTTPQAITLSQSSPIAVDPAEYSELWWDEYTVEQVGYIYYTIADEFAEQSSTFLYETGNGESVYQMGNNYVLNNMTVDGVSDSVALKAWVESYLESHFVPKLPAITFTPATLEAMGLPYLEAGDYLEIDDADGGTVGSYILTRTLNGIQTLTDSIESKGGEVLGDG